MAFIQSRSAIQLVQSPTQDLLFNSNLTAGNMVIAVGGSNVITDILTMSDGVNSYTPLSAIFNLGVISARVFRLFYAFKVAAGATNLTLGGLTGTTSLMAIHEFSLLSNFDTSHSANGTGNSQNSGNATASFPSETLFGFSAGAPNSVTSISPGAGWNMAESAFSGSDYAYITEYQIGVNAGVYNATSSSTTGKSGNFDWAAEIATFYKPAASNTDWQLGGRRHSTRVVFPGRGIDA